MNEVFAFFKIYQTSLYGGTFIMRPRTSLSLASIYASRKEAMDYPSSVEIFTLKKALDGIMEQYCD
jgi:hypothetical protein